MRRQEFTDEILRILQATPDLERLAVKLFRQGVPLQRVRGWSAYLEGALARGLVTAVEYRLSQLYEDRPTSSVL